MAVCWTFVRIRRAPIPLRQVFQPAFQILFFSGKYAPDTGKTWQDIPGATAITNQASPNIAGTYNYRLSVSEKSGIGNGGFRHFCSQCFYPECRWPERPVRYSFPRSRNGCPNLGYNVYGQEVYRAKAALVDWDGTFNGKKQSSGTYIYRVVFNNSRKPMQGTFMLIR